MFERLLCAGCTSELDKRSEILKDVGIWDRYEACVGRKLKGDIDWVNDDCNCDELSAEIYEFGMFSGESTSSAGKPNDDNPDKYDDKPKLARHMAEHASMAAIASINKTTFALITIDTM